MGAAQCGVRGPAPPAPAIAWAPAPVTLHVYDFGPFGDVQSLNPVLRSLGAGGAYHCGIEVYGREWSYFKASSSSLPGGVLACKPRGCKDHSYREPLLMGNTVMTEQQVLRTLAELSAQWTGNSYNVLRRNCCHFATELCRCLGVGMPPEWVMQLSAAGAELEDCLEDLLTSGHPSKGCTNSCCIRQFEREPPVVYVAEVVRFYD